MESANRLTRTHHLKQRETEFSEKLEVNSIRLNCKERINEFPALHHVLFIRVAVTSR